MSKRCIPVRCDTSFFNAQHPKMVRHTLKACSKWCNASVFDHFGTLCIKGLILLVSSTKQPRGYQWGAYRAFNFVE